MRTDKRKKDKQPIPGPSAPPPLPLPSSPDPRRLHHLLELTLAHAPPHARPAVRLEDHVPQQLLVDLLLEHGRDAPQVRHGDDAAAARAARAAGAIVGDVVVVVVAREQAERLVDLAGVRARAVVARPQLERADGHERAVARVALVVRVEDGDELGELVLVSGRDVEGSGWGREREGKVSAVLLSQFSLMSGTRGRGLQQSYIMALRTSPIGMTPSFSPSMGSEKSANASLISASSSAVMSFSLARRDCLAFGGPEPPDAPDLAAPPDFRFAGCHMVRRREQQKSCPPSL